MKTVYDALNHVEVDAQDYDVRPLTGREKTAMKRSFRSAAGIRRPNLALRRSVAAAACLVCVVGFSQTAFAKAAAEDILQYVGLGHNAVMQVKPDSGSGKNGLSGYYDKNGKPLTAPNSSGTTDLYDAKGNKVGTIGSAKSGEASDAGVVAERDLNKAVSQLSFRPLLPQALPAGYAFDRAELYQDGAKVSGDYADFYYKNDAATIIIQERKISQQTVYTMATDDKVQKTTVNGHTAALTGEHDLDWEADGVSVGIVAKAVPTDQLMKLAESMK